MIFTVSFVSWQFRYRYPQFAGGGEGDIVDEDEIQPHAVADHLDQFVTHMVDGRILEVAVTHDADLELVQLFLRYLITLYADRMQKCIDDIFPRDVAPV